ncbi:RNA polymerase sigma factor [Brucella intermedia]|uniref:RNA polymerase sigma factor n=1 Tax=Brucella intermedia TaxID=94625 RepID=UPI00396A3882|nr:RNA polymerase sigma factor [Brucella intermedia]
MTDLVVSDGDDTRPSLSKAIERCYGELKNYARLKIGDDAIAEELVQEACLRLVTSGVETPFNPRAYLYRVLGNLVTDHHRRKARFNSSFVNSDVVDAADDRPDVERELIARQRLAILVEAVSELPPRCRECFVLRRFEGLSHGEIADRMNITRSAVEKHLAVATVHCARRLKAHE